MVCRAAALTRKVSRVLIIDDEEEDHAGENGGWPRKRQRKK